MDSRALEHPALGVHYPRWTCNLNSCVANRVSNLMYIPRDVVITALRILPPWTITNAADAGPAQVLCC